MASPFSNITLPAQTIIGFAFGQAARPAVEPFAQSYANEAWKLHAVKPPDVYQLAAGVAQGQVSRAKAYEWAKEQGFDTEQMDALIEIANVGMPLGLAYEARRRGHLTDDQLRTQFRRLGIEPGWYDALANLQHDRLDLGAIATAVHRGIMRNAGLLVRSPPTDPGNVPRIPVSDLDTLAEFAAHGIDAERARVLVADTGLPLALGEMLQLYNRGKVTADDVRVAVAESNIRNEYMDVALDLHRHLLTPHDYAESELRGVKSHAEAQHGANLSGLNDDDYDTLFAILGRPLNIHQVVTGLARGGTYGGDYGDVPDGPFRDAIRRSAIRPEYARLAYANRFTYPSAFVLRSLAEAGDIGGEAAVQETLEEIGWKPSFAEKVAKAWTSGSSADPHVAKANNQLWTTQHTAYVRDRSDDAFATETLIMIGVSETAIPRVLRRWQREREIHRGGLSAAQIKKAYANAVTNPATGQPWTQDEAVERLHELGWTQADALTYLGT